LHFRTHCSKKMGMASIWCRHEYIQDIVGTRLKCYLHEISSEPDGIRCALCFLKRRLQSPSCMERNSSSFYYSNVEPPTGTIASLIGRLQDVSQLVKVALQSGCEADTLQISPSVLWRLRVRSPGKKKHLAVLRQYVRSRIKPGLLESRPT
jgi:hypothetical protein